MRNKFLLTLFLVLSFGLSNASAQTPTPMAVKTISGGVLNGKALSLVKPSYPAAAKAVGASGAVNVQVTIDEEGNVISAAAVSGHPLLRQACEQAAQSSKFSPTKLENQAVKVTGVIVYNFVMPMTVTEIGYELSLAEKSQSFKKSQISSISRTFPQNWIEEIEALKTLDSRLTAKTAKLENPQVLPLPNVNIAQPNPPNGSYQGSVSTGNIRTKIGGVAIVADEGNYSLDSDAVGIIKDLQSKIESRLSVNEKILWTFRLGTTLGKLKAEIDSDEKTRANLSELNQLGANIAPGVSQSASTKVKEIIESAQQITSDVERKEKLLLLIESLRSIRGF